MDIADTTKLTTASEPAFECIADGCGAPTNSHYCGKHIAWCDLCERETDRATLVAAKWVSRYLGPICPDCAQNQCEQLQERCGDGCYCGQHGDEARS